MLKHMLSSAMIAGFAAGLIVAVLQFTFVEKDILLAEQYETGALVHFGRAPMQGDHLAKLPGTPAESGGVGTAATDHDPATHAADEDTSPLVRHGLTVLFAAITYIGYGLILVAGFAAADHTGRRLSVQTGLLWGLAGFMAFQMAPALGLAPELPGTQSAALAARQAWWFLTAVCTLGGLGLLGYGRGAAPWTAGLVLLAIPHIIGAPEHDSFAGVAPPELAAGFAARSLGVGLIAWVALGGLTAALWTREPA